jgi:hypothetical protein
MVVKSINLAGYVGLIFVEFDPCVNLKKYHNLLTARVPFNKNLFNVIFKFKR